MTQLENQIQINKTLGDRNYSIYMDYLYYVNIQQNLEIQTEEFNTLKQSCAKISYDFIMQLKKVESIQNLITSINNQLTQINTMTNQCLAIISEVITQQPLTPSCNCEALMKLQRKFFENKYYKCLDNMYNKLNNIWQCPHPRDQLVQQLNAINQVYEAEKTQLNTLAITLSNSLTKYYMIKNYRETIETCLNVL